MRIGGRRGRRADRSLPPRPYLPPSTGGAVGALLSSCVVMQAGWESFCASREAGPVGAAMSVAGGGAEPLAALMAVLGAGVLAAGVAMGVLLRHLPGARLLSRWLVWAGPCIALVAVCAQGSIWARQLAWKSLQGVSPGSFTFVIEGDASLSSYGALASARVLDSDGGLVAKVRLSSDGAFEDGSELQLIGRREELARDAWGMRSYMAGEVATVRAVRILSNKMPEVRSPLSIMRDAALKAIDPAASDARALIAGIVCGRTTELNKTDASEAFSQTGTTHLVAVSGSHLALVSALVGAILGKTGWSRRARSAVLLMIMAGYVVFTGGAASALRSLVMVGASLGSGLAGRRPHGLSGLMLSIVALAMIWPGIVFDLGFQLSAASVLFILLMGGYLSFVLERLGAPEALASALSLTLCAQWATLPLTLPIFGEVSLIAPFANLLLGPPMSALLVSGLPAVGVAMLLAPVGVSQVVLLPAIALSRLSIFIAEALSAIPFASLPVDVGSEGQVAAYLVAAAVYLTWRCPTRRAMAAFGSSALLVAACHAVRWTWFAPPAVTVLDIGQGDAILVRDGPSTLLVDAGVDEATASALIRNGVFGIDAVLITHWDLDHWGGLPRVLDLMPVGAFYVARGASRGMPPELEERSVVPIELEAGDRLSVGGFEATVVLPEGPVSGEENEDSLVLSVRYGEDGFGVLLTGDAEAGELVAAADMLGHVDVLKLGHHGSAASVDEELLDLLDPQVGVASAGRDNPYGHPAASTVETLADAGVRFVCTADAGDVSLAPEEGGFVLGTSRTEG